VHYLFAGGQRLASLIMWPKTAQFHRRQVVLDELAVKVRLQCRKHRVPTTCEELPIAWQRLGKGALLSRPDPRDRDLHHGEEFKSTRCGAAGHGIVNLLTLFGGCEDWSLWRLR
jgi:hypothetical protein